jgi:hypothetical protein
MNKMPEGQVDWEQLRKAVDEMMGKKKRRTIGEQVRWRMLTYLPKVAAGKGYCKKHDWFYEKPDCTMCGMERMTKSAIKEGLNPYKGFSPIKKKES